MKQFFKDLLVNPFKQEYPILGILMWCLLTFIIIVFLQISVNLFDSVGLKTIEGKGVIVEKCFEPQHSEIIYVMSGKVLVPVRITHENDWQVKIKIKETYQYFSVSQNQWNNLELNQQVNCTYEKGRLSNDIYNISITKN